MQKRVLATANINAIYLVRNVNGLKQTKICKFYKTKEEFDAANDRAIELCRDKLYAAIVNTAKRLV